MTIDLQNVSHAPVIEELVDLLCTRVQNTDRPFFRVEVAYFLCKIAGCMNVKIDTKDRGSIPVNLYALILAESGYGKGQSINLIEEEVLSGFKEVFLNQTMPTVADATLNNMARDRSLVKQITEEAAKSELLSEYNHIGPYAFTFDSGSTPAVKQLREKIIMSGCGAINLQIDEIGSNISSSVEVLNAFLELYDKGLIKMKLTKSTANSSRSADLSGTSPANALLFGTPTKLLNGGAEEDIFYSLLETGYARRCLFARGSLAGKKRVESDPAKVYAELTTKHNSDVADKWNNHFASLADINFVGWNLEVPDPVGIKLIEYKMQCEDIANFYSDFEPLKKAEVAHRYFKALKLAGALAFIDKSSEITETHLLQAIKLVEESGASFLSILTREKNYMKLARYLASVPTEQTQADLVEVLPFYKGSNQNRKELMDLAVAWGYKNQIIIKKKFSDSIEFFSGETLEATDLNKMILSWSLPNDMAYNYHRESAPWDQLATTLFTQDKFNWVNCWLEDEVPKDQVGRPLMPLTKNCSGHRCTDCVIAGFNLVVLDIDHGVALDTVRELFKDYKYIIYTTKRHQVDGEDRFRFIMPLSHVLTLDAEDYKEFFNNLFKWLPFEVDTGSNQPAKKWTTYANSQIFVNDGKLLDPFPFIPRTSRNGEYLAHYRKYENIDGLKRWFLGKMEEGNRNNYLMQYALCLKDNGYEYPAIEDEVKSLNGLLAQPLAVRELESTVFKSIASKFV